MTSCKTVQFLFSLLPLNRFRALLIRHHIQSCPHCQKRLITQTEILSSLVKETNLEGLAPMWPAVRAKLNGRKREKNRGRGLGWQWGIAGLSAVILMAAVIFVFGFFSNGDFQIMLENGFKVHYTQINNEPAQALLYQPQDTNMIFIWVEKSNEKEMHYEY